MPKLAQHSVSYALYSASKTGGTNEAVCPGRPLNSRAYCLCSTTIAADGIWDSTNNTICLCGRVAG